MELIVINDSKLKVMLSADDMKIYDLDDVSGKHTKEAFRSLMREAKNRCGFNGLEGRVFVQLYRSGDGGGELFVTKLSKEERGSDSDAEWGRADHLYGGEESDDTEYKRYYRDRTIKSRHVIYRFDEMRYLLSVCAVLLTSGYKGESTAYAEVGDRVYYLSLDEETYAAGEHFGRLCPGSFYYYINEHCSRICTNAVSVLGKLA